MLTNNIRRRNKAIITNKDGVLIMKISPYNECCNILFSS